MNDISETSLDNYNFDYVIPEHQNIVPSDLEGHAAILDRMYSPKAREMVFTL
jgi:hypothetical protein